MEGEKSMCGIWFDYYRNELTLHRDISQVFKMRTWWRPWCPRWRRAWQALRGGEVWQRPGPHGRKGCASCCNERDGMTRWRSSRRRRWWRSSWWTWTSWRYRSRGGPTWGRGRCRWRKSRFFSSWGRLSWRRPFHGKRKPFLMLS